MDEARGSRFWTTIQPALVRLYKIVGLLALVTVVVGLLAFLTVNVFYFFDTSWVRPIVIDRSHPKVIELTNQVTQAQLRATQLGTERLEVETQLASLDRAIATDTQFIADATEQALAPKTPKQWLVRRELDKAALAKAKAIAWRTPLVARLDSINARIAEQTRIVKRLAASPYLRAADHSIVVAFVPYENLQGDVAVGSTLYSCAWGLIRCSSVGKVTGILDGEVTGMHPHDESAERGRYVQISVDPGAENDSVLFAGGKPLWLF